MTTKTTHKANHVMHVLCAGPMLLATAATLLLATFTLPATAVAASALEVSVESQDSEVQIIERRGTAGQYRLRFGQGGPGVAETTDLPYNADAAQIQAALNALSNISAGGGSVTVTEPGSGSPNVRVVFDGGPLSGTDVPALVATEGMTPMVSRFPDKVNVVTTVDGGMTRNDRMARYAVTVRNTADTSVAAGDTIRCSPSSNGGSSPAYTFEWRRNGQLIAGETSESYATSPEDEGAVIQCQVTATNTVPDANSGGFAAVTGTAGGGLVVAPAPAVAPPSPPSGGNGVPAPTPANPVAGTVMNCDPGVWQGVTDGFAYEWYVNGILVPGETGSTYAVRAADVPGAIQCAVTGSNGETAVTKLSQRRPTSPRPNPAEPFGADSSSLVHPDVTSGPVTVEIELPPGDQAHVYAFYDPASAAGSSLSPSDWSCTVEPATGMRGSKGVCTTDAPLAPQQSLPPIGVSVALEAGAPDPFVVSVSATTDGVAEPSVAVRELRLGPAAPFGLVEGSLVTALLDGDYGLDHEYTQAGGHPAAATAQVGSTRYRHRHKAGGQSGVGAGGVAATNLVKQLRTDIPPGLVGNLTAVTELCDDPVKLIDISLTAPCPAGSIVGEARYAGEPFGTRVVGKIWARKPLYALEPERGQLAQFAFADTTSGGIYVLNVRLRPEDGYAVSIDTAPISQELPLFGFGASICSYGATASDPLGGSAGMTGCKQRGAPGAFSKPLLTAPTACGDVLETRMSADAWDNPGVFSTIAVEEPAITDCGSVPFTPTVDMSLTSQKADSPSGLDASIDIPSDGFESPEGISQSHLKTTVVKLPEGVSVNPSAATGLQACTDEQLGLKTDREPECPDGSKLATASVTTPALEETLSGVMVLRSPKSTDPESGDMLRMALIVRNRERGILVKLPGSATADPKTGRLVATFDDNPQLPVGHVEVKLKGGDKGVLAMPQRCASESNQYELLSSLTPWSRAHLPAGNGPGTQDPVQNPQSVSVDGDCAFDFDPGLEAGMSTGVARQNGSFDFEFTRSQGDQEVEGLTARLPEGLLARVRDLPLCTNAQAEAGNCPEASRIGLVDGSSGSGSPFVLEQKGEIFLTEGYKGGPYGLMVKIRPVAGPFRGDMELSPIIVRQKIEVDPTTAQVSAISDPFPTIHHGIPLRVRRVLVRVNRDKFMLNPSDCSAKQVGATLTSVTGATAERSNHFQVRGCAALPFKPRITMRNLDRGRRSTLRSWNPRMRFVVRQQGVGEAGISGARVTLPSSVILDQSNLDTTCTRAQMAAEDCPAGSVVGYARAFSPLLNRPVQGPVYLAANGGVRPLPDVVAVLDGEIKVVLTSFIDTVRRGGKGRLRSTFNVVPDAPVSRFVLTMRGGKNRGLLVNSTDLCRTNERAVANFSGHNGKRSSSRPRIGLRFKGCKRARKQIARRVAKRKIARKKAKAARVIARYVG